jgi:hypothetical protein
MFSGKRIQIGVVGTVAVVGLLVGGLVSLSMAHADQPSAATSPQAVGSRAGVVVGALGAGTASATVACPALEGSAFVGCGPVPIGLCCGIRSALGVTATGQASVKGSGANVRVQAIRQAVADAKDQAEAAASAAGIKLGQVLDIQISSSGYPYPLPREGVVVPAETFVSVTVTWAIA